jgi:hypothetical protein
LWNEPRRCRGGTPHGRRFATIQIAATTFAVSPGLSGQAAAQPAGSAFVNFESGHVRRIALSPDGSKLFTVNTPDNRLEIDVGVGPSGLALDEARDRLYVMNRFTHDISIVSNASNPSTAVETAVVPLRFDPEPAVVRDGRPFLYDRRDTSGHGDSACASCHIFGDFDSLAWDLSDPFGAVSRTTIRSA